LIKAGQLDVKSDLDGAIDGRTRGLIGRVRVLSYRFGSIGGILGNLGKAGSM
jgi:hypothetical protein